MNTREKLHCITGHECVFMISFILIAVVLTVWNKLRCPLDTFNGFSDKREGQLDENLKSAPKLPILIFCDFVIKFCHKIPVKMYTFFVHWLQKFPISYGRSGEWDKN